jgi:hypothetical protein
MNTSTPFPPHSCGQEPVVRALIENVAKNTQRCQHLEEGIARIENKLDQVGGKLERKLEEVDRTLNGRMGMPGIVSRVALIMVLLSSAGSLALGAVAFFLRHRLSALLSQGGMP